MIDDERMRFSSLIRLITQNQMVLNTLTGVHLFRGIVPGLKVHLKRCLPKQDTGFREKVTTKTIKAYRLIVCGVGLADSCSGCSYKQFRIVHYKSEFIDSDGRFKIVRYVFVVVFCFCKARVSLRHWL